MACLCNIILSLYVSMGSLFVIASPDFDFIFLEIGRMSISKMTYFVLSGSITLNSVISQLIAL